MSFLATLTLESAQAEAPDKQLTTEITDLTKDSNSVLVAPIQIPKSNLRPTLMSLPDCEQYRPLIEQYDWDSDIAFNIMVDESGCRAEVINDNPSTGDYSVGLFQINLYGGNAKHRPSEEELQNPETNIEFAYKLYKSSGFYSQWGVCRKSVNCYN